MNPRSLIGYLCLAAGFALIIALGTGAMDPIGLGAVRPSGAALLRAMVPHVLLAAALFALGLWLVKGRPRP